MMVVQNVPFPWCHLMRVLLDGGAIVAGRQQCNGDVGFIAYLHGKLLHEPIV